MEANVATSVIAKTAPTARNDAPAAALNLRTATDDEILNLSPRAIPRRKPAGNSTESATEELPAANSLAAREADAASPATTPAPAPSAEPLDGAPEEIRAALAEHPELRSAWDDAAAFRESFASPEEARDATRLVGDLNRLDALFFSSRPEDHAELARVVSELSPAAAASLASALSRLATARRDGTGTVSSGASRTDVIPRESDGPAFSSPTLARQPAESRNLSSTQEREGNSSASPAQTEFFHAANAGAVEGVLDAIHAQVNRLLPEGTSQAARNRVVGEIYRELDISLRSNRQLAEQLRQAFRSGTLDAAHQRAVVSLITSRARQALPGVAKRVMNEWTAALVSSGADRRARQRAAESRVDIGGSGRSGAEGRRTLSPREIDYSRLSDADILNL
jgi:hypothetical protein